MAIASMGLLCLFALLPGQASLIGTWTLDRARSDLGAGDVPKQFIVRLDRDRNHLAVTTVTVDATGKHLAYRRAEPEGRRLRVNANTSDVSENWRINSAIELTITRLITTCKAHVIQQKLVLVRSTLKLCEWCPSLLR